MPIRLGLVLQCLPGLTLVLQQLLGSTFLLSRVPYNNNLVLQRLICCLPGTLLAVRGIKIKSSRGSIVARRRFLRLLSAFPSRGLCVLLHLTVGTSAVEYLVLQ